MKPSGIHHVSICVGDVPEAVKFYVDALGLTELPRPDFGFPGAWLEAGGQQVHLMQIEGDAPMMNHFAIRVDDTDACVHDLQELGVDVRVSDYLPGAGRQAFLRDPWGNQIELNQPDA